MAVEFRAAFIDFQQYGKRKENALLRYGTRFVELDRRQLGKTKGKLPFGAVKHDQLTKFLVQCWKTGVVPISRLPNDQGFIFENGKIS